MAEVAPTHDKDGRYIGPEEKTIPLRKKLKRGDETVDSITVKEPTADNLAKSLAKEAETNNPIEGNIVLVAFCTGLTPAEARALGKRDFEEARDFALGFFDVPPATAVAGQ